ncbi:hypothetical protein GOBAR_AA08254 [Gossypium barbadense]|uniref:Uncharacterized protein n=1 Tax=Gossypium barbadense TaxID=3634 RepID=A0A2P5Y9X1_GOSBA|nr:hypothetical protein GOBAR_AA08254 [Gossypium barbadense]
MDGANGCLFGASRRRVKHRMEVSLRLMRSESVVCGEYVIEAAGGWRREVGEHRSSRRLVGISGTGSITRLEHLSLLVHPFLTISVGPGCGMCCYRTERRRLYEALRAVFVRGYSRDTMAGDVIGVLFVTSGKVCRIRGISYYVIAVGSAVSFMKKTSKGRKKKNTGPIAERSTIELRNKTCREDRGTFRKMSRSSLKAAKLTVFREEEGSGTELWEISQRRKVSICFLTCYRNTQCVDEKRESVESKSMRGL